MKRFNQLISEDTKKKEDNKYVYAVFFDDGIMYNYFYDQEDADLCASELHNEMPSNNMLVKKIPLSEIVKESLEINEGVKEFFNDLTVAFKKIFSTNQGQDLNKQYHNCIEKANSIGEMIKSWDSQNGKQVSDMLRKLSDITNSITNDLWDRFDNESEEEKQKIIEFWKVISQVFSLMELYQWKLNNIANQLREQNFQITN